MRSDLRIGILGGGQLARMLAEAAEKLEVNVRVYVESSRDPAARVVDEFVKGSLNDQNELRRFFQTVDLVIFENEFVNCNLLERAAAGLELRFIPNLEAIRCLQNKLNQKTLLNRLQILTADHFEILSEGSELKNAISKWKGEAVIKWAQLGYDGKGTFFLSEKTKPADIEIFLNEAKKKNILAFAEEKIKFKRELAIQSAHSANGDLVHYPLVISEQEQGVCRWVKGPATKLGADTKLEIEAQNIAKKIAKELSIYGVFAIEFFEGEDGRLYVNELAPRVHNTGHYSMTAAKTSQFENHILGVLGLDLGSTESAPFFSMLNLLGPFSMKGSVPASTPSTVSSCSLYWYDKTEVRKGRKMGHLSGQAHTKDEFEDLVKRMAKVEQDWAQSILEREK